MSTVGISRTYDTMKAVTKADTGTDPAGPFAGLLVTVAGTLKITTVKGDTVSLVVIAGQEIHTPVSLVWSTGSAATVFGLIAEPYNAKASS